MSVTVSQLYKSSKSEYGLRPVAGTGGTDRLVQWVHIIEGGNAASFLRGNELVFTTGVMNNTGKWLLNFVKQIHKANASALVVNVGPYIPDIDADVTDYCNRENFPLFTLPWETRMVDVTRDFCMVISSNMNNETDISLAFKNLVFRLGRENEQLMSLEANGFKSDSFSHIACIALVDNSTELTEKIKTCAEQAAKAIQDLYCAFEYEHGQSCIILMYEYSSEDILAFTAAFKRLLRANNIEDKVCIGISERIDRLNLLGHTKTFEHAVAACKMAAKRNELLLRYDDLDIYKLLLAIEDKTVLRDYYDQTLGKLAEYDREHNSSYMEFLKTYLENNASAQLVSEKEFIHRNTVVNYLKKIDTITGLNMFELDSKVKCMIAFGIQELL